MSEHEILGDVTITTAEADARVTTYQEGIAEVKSTTYVAFGLIALMILVAAAFGIVAVFNQGANMAQMMTIAIGAIGAAIILLVGYVIISAVAGGLI